MPLIRLYSLMNIMEAVKVAIVFISLAVVTDLVQSENQLEIQPTGPEIIKPVGSNLALTCSPNVEKPDEITQLEWRDPQGRRIDTTNGDADLYTQNLPESSRTVLFFSKIREDMAGTYTCTAKYSNTEELIATKNVKTIVEIKWIDAPEDQYPKIGEDYTVRCEVQANPSPIVEWIHNGASITSKDRYVVKSNGLLIKNVRESDDGLYICRAVVISTGEILLRNIRVEVQIPPKIEPMKDIEIVENEQASIICKAIGKPPPEYTWIKERTRDDLSITNRFSVKKNQGLLMINPVQFIDTSNYTCVAENRAGRDEITVQVNVLSPPRIYGLKNITLPIQSEAKIVCKATGRPLPFVTFRKLSSRKQYEVGIQNDDDRIILEQQVDNSKGEAYGILTIRNLRRSDDGLYECIAQNAIRNAYLNGHITVEFPPTFDKTKDYPPIWTWGNRLANLSCIAESIPNATIEWRRHSIPIVGNRTNMWIIGNGPQSFLILRVGNDHTYTGKYECRASNRLGNESSFIEVKQASVPEPVQQVKVDTITATTIKFSIVGPPNFRGLPLRKFLVQYQTERERNWNTARNYTWTVDAPYTLENLIPEEVYNFRFAAINDVGMGGWGGNQQLTMPRRSVPAEPKILVPNYHPDDMTQDRDIIITSSYADHFDVRWNVPNDNGDPIDSYIIRYCVNEKINGEWRENSDRCSPEIIHSFQYTNYELKNLEPDTVYRIELRAHNAIGSSSPAQIRVRTARGLNSMVYQQEPIISSSMIVAIVVAAIIVLLVIVDITCCCVNRAGILALIVQKIKSKPIDEEDPKLGREEREPLKPSKRDQPEFINSEKKNISVEFDGQRVYSRPNDLIIGKNSAV